MKALGDREVATHWDSQAKSWTDLVREGYDLQRDRVNAPAFIKGLPEVTGLKGLDVGCGEGKHTRVMASLGAEMIGVDISTALLRQAVLAEQEVHSGTVFQFGSATALPCVADAFDFVTAFMSLMDIADYAKAVGEVYRVLKPGGFFQFSICHPCFHTPRWDHVKDDEGNLLGVVCGDYFKRGVSMEEWVFSGLDPKLRRSLPTLKTPVNRHTLSDWMQVLLGAGFHLEYMDEPSVSDEVVAQYPQLQATQTIAYFLILRFRK